MKKILCLGYGENYTPQHPKCIKCKLKEKCREEFLNKDFSGYDTSAIATFLAEQLLDIVDHLPESLYSGRLCSSLRLIRTKVSPIIDK